MFYAISHEREIILWMEIKVFIFFFFFTISKKDIKNNIKINQKYILLS